MAYLRIKASAIQAATYDQQHVFTVLIDDLGLGCYCWKFSAPNGVIWHFFRDHDIPLVKTAYLGCLFANQAAIFAAWTPPSDVDQLKAELRAILEDPGLVHPLVKHPTVDPGDPEPWQTVLDAQDCPNFCKITSLFPDNMTDVTPYPYSPVEEMGSRPKKSGYRYAKNLVPNEPLISS